MDTGDLAYCLADGDCAGYIRIAGRTKDVIIRGGENIPVVEIENLLVEHPAITIAALVGYPDERLGERACAFVVAENGATVSLDDLRLWMDEKKVAKQYWPERIEIIQAMPRTPAARSRNSCCATCCNPERTTGAGGPRCLRPGLPGGAGTARKWGREMTDDTETAAGFPPGWTLLDLEFGFARSFGPVGFRETADQQRAGLPLRGPPSQPLGNMPRRRDRGLCRLRRAGCAICRRAVPDRHPTVTLSIDFLHPVLAGQWVTARVEITGLTRKMCFTQMVARVENTPVMSSRGIFKVSTRDELIGHPFYLKCAELWPSRVVDREQEG